MKYTFAILSSALALAPTPTLAAPDSQAHSGHVFIFATEVPRPWAFSGVGSDTLRLNGIPFLPVRQVLPPLPPVTQLARDQHALGMAAGDTFRRARGSIEKKLEAERKVYIASSLVDSVRLDRTVCSDGLILYWNGQSYPAYVILRTPNVRPEPPMSAKEKRRHMHESMIQEFWHSMSLGRVLVMFGSYASVSCPSEDYLVVSAAMSAIRARKTPPFPDGGTCLPAHIEVEIAKKYWELVGNEKASN